MLARQFRQHTHQMHASQLDDNDPRYILDRLFGGNPVAPCHDPVLSGTEPGPTLADRTEAAPHLIADLHNKGVLTAEAAQTTYDEMTKIVLWRGDDPNWRKKDPDLKGLKLLAATVTAALQKSGFDPKPDALNDNQNKIMRELVNWQFAPAASAPAAMP